eukprot:Blabericola_migrator_1__12398@NODE_77_length_15155_cov_63_173383_g69_i0_p2_GENE_NODE_77_length_15155_cov_63_173383_g69_i0NODE_77_length_15155_cov_63_173383_g69_i0_p2_ORF_typecomplete_len1025_score207_61Actino_peptide/PF14408_6/0_15_NODE_77_length_15155_cov_63_173383_g69_i0717010244
MEGRRGRGRASAKSVVARAKKNVVKTPQQEGEEPSAFQLDANGRIIADIPPPKRFPSKTSETFIKSFLQDVEFGAMQTQASQTVQSERPRRLLDRMKVTPIETWPNINDLVTSTWKAPRQASSEGEAIQLRKFFDMVVEAMEKDVEAAAIEAGFSVTAEPTDTKSTSKSILSDIEKTLAKGGKLEPFWLKADPYDYIHTDSEEEEDGRAMRYPPALQLLRRTRRQLVRQEQRGFLVGRSLALVQEGAGPSAVVADNLESVAHRLRSRHDKQLKAQRLDYRDWVRASRYAQTQFSWAPHGDLIKSRRDDVGAKQLRNGLVSLFLTEMGKLWPSRLLSKEMERAALRGSQALLPSPYKWIIDDFLCLSEEEIANLKLTPLKVVSVSDQRLYFGNLLQILGRPMGRNYSHLMFQQDFKFWLMSLGERGLYPMQTVQTLRPSTRQLRSLVAKRLNKASQTTRETDDGLIEAMGAITNPGSRTHTEAATTAECEDSAASQSEDDQMRAEASTIKALVNSPEKASLATSGYGPENVLMRIGGGIGRLRNTFDVNRARRMDLELLKQQSTDPVPVVLDSSEDEKQLYRGKEGEWRRHYRDNKRVAQAVAEVKRYSDWPGRATDRLRATVAAHEAELESSQPKKPRHEDSVTAGLIDSEMLDEAWRTFNLKPRVRHIEPRMDLDKTTKRPIGFLAKGVTPHGRELQLLGIDEGEFQRRFGLTKLMQKSMNGLSATLAYRRRFAAVINESTGEIKIVAAAPCRLVLSDSPEEAHRDMMWKFYWHQARAGVHEQRLVRKSWRYRTVYENNSIAWKEDLDRYQKLRQKLSEVQAHQEVRFMKVRTSGYGAKKELGGLGVPDFDYAYGSKGNEEHEVNALTESDLSEFEYKQVCGTMSACDTTAGSEVEFGLPAAPTVRFKCVEDAIGNPATLTVDEVRGQARRAKLNAEEMDTYSNVRKVRRHMRVAWNGTETALRKKIAARHRALLPTLFYKYSRQYRSHYNKIRTHLTERIAYETAFAAGKIRATPAAKSDEE